MAPIKVNAAKREPLLIQTKITAINRNIAHYKGKLQVELNPAAAEEVAVSTETTATFKAWMHQ